MTKEQIIEKIKLLKSQLFLIDMIEHWEESTYKRYDELISEVNSLKEKLKQIGGV